MSPASVTKHVAALEARVGARLFDRTTRSVSLTEVGRIYLTHCLECLQTFEDAETSVSEFSKQPKGILRVAAPIDFQNEVSAVVARFMIAYPEVTVDLQLSNRTIDLVEEGIDIAIRAAASLDGRYVARVLAPFRITFFASPAYLERHGHPEVPRDLESHRAIVFAEPRPRNEWTLERDRDRVTVKLNGILMSNNAEALRAALVEGVALGPLPGFLVRSDLDAGRVVPILPEWKVLPEIHLYAIYPHRRFLAPKVRVFLETLRATYGDGTTDPWQQQSPPSRSDH